MTHQCVTELRTGCRHEKCLSRFGRSSTARKKRVKWLVWYYLQSIGMHLLMYTSESFRRLTLPLYWAVRLHRCLKVNPNNFLYITHRVSRWIDNRRFRSNNLPPPWLEIDVIAPWWHYWPYLLDLPYFVKLVDWILFT